MSAPLDPRDWGPAPTARQLAAAAAVAAHTHGAAVAGVLADALTCKEVACRLGITPATVRARIRRGELLAIKHARRWHLPGWQLDRQGALPGLVELIAAWPGTPLALATWATRHHVDLGDRSPAELLRSRYSAPVLALAHAIATAGC